MDLTDESWAPSGCGVVLDALGLRCPMPVLKLEAALRRIAPGARVAMRCDDPVAVVDVPHAAASGGHDCERIETGGEEDWRVFVVTRGPRTETG